MIITSALSRLIYSQKKLFGCINKSKEVIYSPIYVARDMCHKIMFMCYVEATKS